MTLQFLGKDPESEYEAVLRLPKRMMSFFKEVGNDGAGGL
jgi:hypothetical protein